MATHDLIGEFLHGRVLGPNLGGPFQGSLGLGRVAAEGSLLGGKHRHIRSVDRVIHPGQDSGTGEVTGATADLIHVGFNISEIALVAEALQFPEVAPKVEHLALLDLLIHHHRRLKFSEKVSFLKALKSTVELTLLVEVVDGSHARGDVTHGLAGQRIDRFQRRHEIRDREELLHFLGADLDVLITALEEDAVEGASDEAVTVATGEQEADHLRLKLYLRLQAQRDHLRILGEDFGLRTLFILHPIAELGLTLGSLVQGRLAAASGRRRIRLRIIGFL